MPFAVSWVSLAKRTEKISLPGAVFFFVLLPRRPEAPLSKNFVCDVSTDLLFVSFSLFPLSEKEANELGKGTFLLSNLLFSLEKLAELAG